MQNRRKSPLWLLPVVSMLSCSTKVNHKISDRNARVREYADQVIREKQTPGLQYLVVNAAGPVFSYAGGLAEIATGRPMLLQTTQMAYSMTKTFTAAAVLRLVAQGKIDLDLPANRYLPEIPYGHEVKIRHLLAQTSGIPDPLPLKWVHLVHEHAGFDEKAELARILNENAKLRFSPGSKYAYSNISYWLLGQIIERVTGISYEDYMVREIFRPLGINPASAAFVIATPDEHARGYLREWSMPDLLKGFLVDQKFIGKYEAGWLNINDHYLNGAAFGGLVASAQTVGIFLRDQLQPKSAILAPGAKELFYQQQMTPGGKAVPMTLGWHVGTTGGKSSARYYFKEGGGAGFHCEMRLYPEQGLASVVMANSMAFDVKTFLQEADAEFLAAQ